MELLVVLAVLALVALVVLPALASNRPRSQRFLCANNLRQVGVAFQLWGNDHDDLFPWEVRPDRGGTYSHVLAPNVWLHFSWVSNELAGPKLVFCPADSGQPAQEFSGDPNTGYLHPNFANRATSYFLAHAFKNTPTAVIAGDRNVTAQSVGSCSRFRSVFSIGTQPVPGISWNDGVHGAGSGNLLRLDGSIAVVENSGLRDAISTPRDDNGNFHFILPR